jgi:hypothetical protein
MAMTESAIRNAVLRAHPSADPGSIGHADGVVTFAKNGQFYGADVRRVGNAPAILRAEPLDYWVEGRPDFAMPMVSERWSEREVAEPEIDAETGNPIPEVGFWDRARPGAKPPGPAVSGRSPDYAEPLPNPAWS